MILIIFLAGMFIGLLFDLAGVTNKGVYYLFGFVVAMVAQAITS